MKKFKGLEIDNVTLTEKLQTSSGDYTYFAGIDVSIKTQSDFNLETGVYENPNLDLSQDLGLHLLVVYSRRDIISGPNPASLINSEDTLVEIRKLTQKVRDQNNNLDKSLFVNPNQAIKMIDPTYREELGIPSDVAFRSDVKYKFSFEKDLTSLYEEGELPNIRIAIFPFFVQPQSAESYSGIELKEDDEVYFYEKQEINLLQDGKISDDALAEEKIKDLRTEYYDKIFNFDIFAPENLKKETASSELFSSYGKKSQVKGMFILDKVTLLKNESLFGNFLNNKGLDDLAINDITTKSSIKNLKLSRNKIKNLRDFENNPIPISRNIIISEIVSTMEVDGNIFKGKTIKQGSEQVLAEIGELKLDKENNRYKYVIFSDYDTSQDGKYVYSTQIRMQDGIRLFLKESYNILNTNKNSLELYHGQKYVNKSEPTSSRDDIATIIDNIATQIEILNDFAYDNTAVLRKEMFNLTLYEQTLLNLIKFVNRIVSKMAKTLQIRQDTLIRSAATNAKILQDRSMIIYNKSFSDYVEFTGIENLSYDYVGIPQNSNIGISLISESDLRERFTFEFNKIIKRSSDVDFDDLSKKIFRDTFGRNPSGTLEESYFNMGDNYFTFLSPIQIGNVELTKENTFNNTIFNEFHLSQVTNDFLSPLASLSYSVLGFSISINKQFIEKNNPKNDNNQKQTYVNMDEVLAPQDRANSTTTPNPFPLLPKFDGPTDTREKYSSFVNAILKDEEKWDIDKSTFSQASLGRSYVDDLPNQIRILFANSDVCLNKWLSTDGDYFFNPDTYYMIKENYMNLAQIQVVKFIDGSLGNPDYENLNSSHLEGQSPIICRMVLPVDENFRIGSKFANRSYSNRYFIIIPSKDVPLTATNIVVSDTVEPVDTPTRKSFKAKEVPDYVINGPANLITP